VSVSFDDKPHVAPVNYSSIASDHRCYGSSELHEAQVLVVDLPFLMQALHLRFR